MKLTKITTFMFLSLLTSLPHIQEVHASEAATTMITVANEVRREDTSNIDTTIFSKLDLSRVELRNIGELYSKGDTELAMQELLEYYKNRKSAIQPYLDLDNLTISDEHQRWADDGLEHKFFVHLGYQPSFFYGKDIDWQHWPVQDNELRWQLHRTKWWVPMGKAYRLSKDEKYAKAWTYQYLDWIEKNPLTEYKKGKIEYISADNVYFAWRPLEVSDRLEFQIDQFLLFLQSPSFDANFISHFLTNYHRQAKHITENFSQQGNHLLFQAQRLLYAAVFFPEFKESKRWREIAINILNAEIQKQVYDDGIQYELDPHYHHESIIIFFNALRMSDVNGYRDEFPKEYLDTVEKMIDAHYNISFPDYTNPTFSDAKQHNIDYMLPNYKVWSEVFIDNEMLKWLATQTKSGEMPSYLSKAFSTSGFYVLRNGWKSDATVMVVKAGPPAFWHNQPDNGTFELWHQGRNFFPDSGSYVYAGDKEINELRRWFRQTRVHNTLTLNREDIEVTDSKNIKWLVGEDNDMVIFENQSYLGLNHRRTILFVDRSFYVIVDQAEGVAEGEVAIHYNFVEGELEIDEKMLQAQTQFEDGNNIILKVFGEQPTKLRVEQGRVSRAYRVAEERDILSFESLKREGQSIKYITVIIPVNGKCTPKTEIEASFSGRGKRKYQEIKVSIDDKKYRLKL